MVLYVLVGFVILFLVASVVAVLQYMKADELQTRVADLERAQEELANRRDLDEVRQRVGDTDKTRLRALMDRVEDLARWIDPQASSYAGAEKAWESLLAEEQDLARDMPRSDQGLIPLVRALRNQIQSNRQTIAQLESDVAKAQSLVEDKQQAIEQLQTKQREALAAIGSDYSKLAEQAQQRQQAHLDALAKAEDEKKEAIRQRDARIDELTDKVNQQAITISQKDALIDKLMKKREDERERIAGGGAAPTEGADGGDEAPVSLQVARQADGKILKVVSADDVCYINLGEGDRVRPGMTFSVYSDKGIPRDGEGKATIVVTSVEKSISECRIVSRRGQAPVLKDDLIGNVAFSALRDYKFMVFGRFDLYGTGEATAEQAGIVKNLVREFGAQITDDVTIETDFIVLGQEPTRPPTPREGASDQEEYNRRLQQYRKYQEIQDVAQRLRIPILNTSRFLAFTGYQPQKTRKY
jgi:hypothetical protein